MRMNGGTRRREAPRGTGELKKEIDANLLLDRVLIMIGAIEKLGGFWTIENPASSYLWLEDSVAALCRRPGTVTVRFDQCAYGLKGIDADGTFVKKPTQIIGNLELLENLERNCPKNHVHTHCLGWRTIKGKRVSRAAEAGRYPNPLCRRWAGIIAGALLVRD